MSGADQCPLFGVERCPLLGGSKCISSMVKSIGASEPSTVQRLSAFGGSVIRGVTVYQNGEHTTSAECSIFYHKYPSAASMASVTSCS